MKYLAIDEYANIVHFKSVSAGLHWIVHCVCALESSGFVYFPTDVADRVWPAGVLRAAALPGLWLAEDQVGGQSADPPHPRRSPEPRYHLQPCFSYKKCLIYILFSLLLPLHLHLSLSPAVAREVRDEGRSGSLFGGVCGNADESSGQVPEASRWPPRPFLQSSSKRFLVCQGKTKQGWKAHLVTARFWNLFCIFMNNWN